MVGSGTKTTSHKTSVVWQHFYLECRLCQNKLAWGGAMRSQHRYVDINLQGEQAANVQLTLSVFLLLDESKFKFLFN